jgi:lipopolysaccharide export system protein LptC
VTARRQRLRHIQPRRRYTGGGAGHTWFVRITKFILPVCVLVIVGIVTARLSQDKQSLQIAQAPTHDKTTPGQIDLVKPKYEGLDAKNRPYTISADRAHRVMGQEQVVALEKPKGDILMDDKSWIAVEAAAGTFNNTAQVLFLSDGVKIFHDSGYELHLKDVTVDLKTRHAQTHYPVDGQGPQAGISAQDLEVTDEGAMVIFGGPVKLTLWNISGKEKHG